MEKKESKAQERKEHLAMKIVEKAKGGKKPKLYSYEYEAGKVHGSGYGTSSEIKKNEKRGMKVISKKDSVYHPN